MKTTANAEVKFLAKVTPFDEGGKPNVVLFRLGNGQEVAADLSRIPADVLTRLTIHGLSQKVGDSTAGCSKDKAYGAAFECLSGVVEGLYAGKWNTGREGGGTSDLVIALARLKKLDVETVAQAVRQADEATVKAWMKNPKVDAEVKVIRLARAKEAAKGSSVDNIEI